MTVIGITGPTGAGKTTALQVLAELDFEIVDCDALYYQLLRTDAALRHALTDAFGPVFLTDGSLDRRVLARRVFSSETELAKLNSIVFPAVSAAVKQKIVKCSQKGLAIDAINLVESGMGEMCDATAAVTASPDIRLRRIMVRDGLSWEQAKARIDAQKSAAWYQAHCTFVLENLEEDRETCRTLMREFFNRILEWIEEGGHNDGSKRMEREASNGEKERL